jgi:hypothetical protein
MLGYAWLWGRLVVVPTQLQIWPRNLATGWEERTVLAEYPFAHQLPARSMPFVNRDDEVFELLEANVHTTLKLTSGHRVVDFRTLRICFGAQMIGSGKTTFGENFVKALSFDRVEKHIEKRLKERLSDYGEDDVERFRREWVLAKQAVTLYVDNHVCKSFEQVLKLLAAATGVPESAKDDPSYCFADVVMRTAAAREAMLFVHVDEIGGLPEDGLQKLQDGVARVWLLINRRALAGEQVPLIHFFFSGRDISQASLGGSASPVGTRWIILNMLLTEHVTTIRKHLQCLKDHPLQLRVRLTFLSSLLAIHDCPSGLYFTPHCVLVFQGLLSDDVAVYLDQQLQFLTGGAPRLLLYTLRALYHNRNSDMSNRIGVDVALDAAYKLLASIAPIELARARFYSFDRGTCVPCFRVPCVHSSLTHDARTTLTH